MDLSIIIPLYNQLRYTQICLDSLRTYGVGGGKIFLIDNGSTDGTGAYLAECPDVVLRSNRENLGCAGAWNQGVRDTTSEWLVFLNNDVIVSPGWLEGLMAFAEDKGADIVSPAIREGECNYEICSYSRDFATKMVNAVRMGVADGICFMVRRRVFETIGLFDENFRIGQFEDADFFRRAQNAGFRLGTTGRSFIHHFGSVTQDSIRKNKTAKPYEAENRAYYRRKWNLTWWKRFRERQMRKCRGVFWRTTEKLRYGHTLKEKWLNGRLRYY